MAHKRPIFSFEFFPPKTEKGEKTLWRSLEHLAPLEPDYISVTYGAGGSTRDRTLSLVARIKREMGIEPMAHLTCVGSTVKELENVVDQLGEAGIENILALRGDPPKGETEFKAVEGGLRYANELVELIKGRGDFCIGAACYPECHVEATSDEDDLRHLKTKVDAGAEFLVSQLFFDNAHFWDFNDRARGVGIDVPIVPGIMPVTNVAQIERFTKMCGASIPEVLHTRLSALPDDPVEVFWAGVTYAAHQCRGLLEPGPRGPFDPGPRGVPGIHFYTLNKSPATRAIFEILKLSKSAL